MSRASSVWVWQRAGAVRAARRGNGAVRGSNKIIASENTFFSGAKTCFLKVFGVCFVRVCTAGEAAADNYAQLG